MLKICIWWSKWKYLGANNRQILHTRPSKMWKKLSNFQDGSIWEQRGDWDEYVLMNMWRSPNVPTSHLSNCPAATLPLVNFALFFLFLTKHYIYMFSSSSIDVCTVQNVPQHVVWYCALIVYIKSWAQILLVRATGPKSMWGPNNIKLWAWLMLGASRQWPTF